MVAARLGLGPLRHCRPDVVIDSQNGLPFLARLAFGHRVIVLVHHCHREQWPVAGRVLGRVGWFVESRLSPRLHRHNQYVTVSLPSVRDLAELGVDTGRVAVVRNGLDEAPPHTLTGERSVTPRVVVLSRLVPHKQIEDALDAVAVLRPRVPDLHLDVVGGGWWQDRLLQHAQRLGIAEAVTFHGHVDDVTKHALLQRSWTQLLPSRKEGWGLAVIEAAQHGVPTIGYRSSGGLIDSIVDGRIHFNCFAHVESPRAAYGTRSAVLFALLSTLRDKGIEIGTVPQKMELVRQSGTSAAPTPPSPAEDETKMK
jgi:glycosyltransferase involved in cell wall biosynthesis